MTRHGVFGGTAGLCLVVLLLLSAGAAAFTLEYTVEEHRPSDTYVADLARDAGVIIPDNAALDFSFSQNSDALASLFTLEADSGILYTAQVSSSMSVHSK